jgi:hypothetical protein
MRKSVNPKLRLKRETVVAALGLAWIIGGDGYVYTVSPEICIGGVLKPERIQ